MAEIMVFCLILGKTGCNVRKHTVACIVSIAYIVRSVSAGIAARKVSSACKNRNVCKNIAYEMYFA